MLPKGTVAKTVNSSIIPVFGGQKPFPNIIRGPQGINECNIKCTIYSKPFKTECSSIQMIL